MLPSLPSPSPPYPSPLPPWHKLSKQVTRSRAHARTHAQSRGAAPTVLRSGRPAPGPNSRPAGQQGIWTDVTCPVGRRGAGAGTAVFRAVVRGYSFSYPIQKYHGIVLLYRDNFSNPRLGYIAAILLGKEKLYYHNIILIFIIVIILHGPQRHDPAGGGGAGC